tara:strand:+ start:838 stop:1065 length:228 start_codon:yes stop_codon:yes gene_type:complete
MQHTKLETNTMQITNEQFLELSADIAGAWLEDAYLDNIWQEEDNGDMHYTNDAQDRFNDILDTVQDMLNDYVEVL